MAKKLIALEILRLHHDQAAQGVHVHSADSYWNRRVNEIRAFNARLVPKVLSHVLIFCTTYTQCLALIFFTPRSLSFEVKLTFGQTFRVALNADLIALNAEEVAESSVLRNVTKSM